MAMSSGCPEMHCSLSTRHGEEPFIGGQGGRHERSPGLKSSPILKNSTERQTLLGSIAKPPRMAHSKTSGTSATCHHMARNLAVPPTQRGIPT